MEYLYILLNEPATTRMKQRLEFKKPHETDGKQNKSNEKK